MKSKLRKIAVASIISLVLLPALAVAQDAKQTEVPIAKEDNANERIILAGQLRVLSQRIPSAACQKAAGIDPKASTKKLTNAILEFEKILNALEFGDSDLSIQGAELRPKTIAQLHETREMWLPFKSLADAFATEEATDEELKALLSQDDTVLNSAQALVFELVAQYSAAPSTTQANLLSIDFAGRQSMLTKKMAKEACMIMTGTGDADTARDLQGSIQLFEMTLEALRFGMPEVGVRPPSTPEVYAGLESVLNEWKGVKPELETVLSGATLDAEAKAKKVRALDSVMGSMNKVVALYAQVGQPGL